MVSEEGLNAYGALTWGQFFIYQGFNDKAGWMHTSSGVDNIDEYLETVTKKDNGVFYKFGSEERPITVKKVVDPVQDADRHGAARVHRLSHAPRPDRPPGGWQVGVGAADGRADKGAHPVVLADQGTEHCRLQEGDGPPHQLIEQHALRRCGREHRLLPLELRAEARPEAGLGEAAGRQQAGYRLAGNPHLRRKPERRQSQERMGGEHQQLAVLGRRPGQSEAKGLSAVLRSRR